MPKLQQCVYVCIPVYYMHSYIYTYFQSHPWLRVPPFHEPMPSAAMPIARHGLFLCFVCRANKTRARRYDHRMGSEPFCGNTPNSKSRTAHASLPTSVPLPRNCCGAALRRSLPYTHG